MLDIADLSSRVAQAVLQETRLRMLAVLSSPRAHVRGGYTISELGELLGCSSQNAHHHLKILQRVGAARVVRSEATQRIPRQFWLSDVHRVRLRPPQGGDMTIETGIPEEALEDLAKALTPWADAQKGAESLSLALDFAAFVLSQDRATVDALLEIIEDHRAKRPNGPAADEEAGQAET